MFYDHYYWGMHFFWWFAWIMLLIWIFAIPYDIPGQRRRKDTALDILQKRFASGEITTDDYNHKRKILENDMSGLK